MIMGKVLLPPVEVDNYNRSATGSIWLPVLCSYPRGEFILPLAISDRKKLTITDCTMVRYDGTQDPCTLTQENYTLGMIYLKFQLSDDIKQYYEFGRVYSVMIAYRYE